MKFDGLLRVIVDSVEPEQAECVAKMLFAQKMANLLEARLAERALNRLADKYGLNLQKVFASLINDIEGLEDDLEDFRPGGTI